MNLKQMKSRCPSASVISIAMLSNYELFFTKKGVPSVKAVNGSTVWGVLWQIDQDCVKSLDEYEGFPKLYTKVNLEVETHDKQTIKTFVYIATSNEEGSPENKYIKVIKEGARDNNLPDSYIHSLNKRYGKF